MTVIRNIVTRPMFTYVHVPPQPCRCDLCSAEITASVFPPTCRRCDLVIDLWAMLCGMCSAGDEVIECPMCDAMRARPATISGRVGGSLRCDRSPDGVEYVVDAPFTMVVHPSFEHARIADRVGGAFARALAAAYAPEAA